MYHVLVQHNSIENLAVKMLSNEIKLYALAVSINALIADSSFILSRLREKIWKALVSV